MPSKNMGTRHAESRQSLQRDGSGAEEERAGACSSHTSDDTCPPKASASACGKRYSNRTIENGRRVLREAAKWQRPTPPAWSYIVREALRLAAEGKRIGVQRLIEYVRAHDFADTEGKPTKTNNSFVPVFSRQLVRKYPRLSDYIERRASVFDVIGVGECPPVGFDFSSIESDTETGE